MEEKEMLHFDLRGVPIIWQNAIKKVYGSYPKDKMPMGICDMAYIINTISHEIGLSDGKGNYFQSPFSMEELEFLEVVTSLKSVDDLFKPEMHNFIKSLNCKIRDMIRERK